MGKVVDGSGFLRYLWICMDDTGDNSKVDHYSI